MPDTIPVIHILDSTSPKKFVSTFTCIIRAKKSYTYIYKIYISVHSVENIYSLRICFMKNVEKSIYNQFMMTVTGELHKMCLLIID